MMKKVLITGGTTFVSKYAAKYFKEHNYDVYVLNRNTKPQVEGVTLIEGNRHEFHQAPRMGQSSGRLVRQRRCADEGKKGQGTWYEAYD